MTTYRAGRQEGECSPWRTHRLWSPWEMIVLRPIELMNIIQTVIGTHSAARHISGPLPSELVESIAGQAKTIDEIAESLELPLPGRRLGICWGVPTRLKNSKPLCYKSETPFLWKWISGN